jgi:hypothetical protein
MYNLNDNSVLLQVILKGDLYLLRGLVAPFLTQFRKDEDETPLISGFAMGQLLRFSGAMPFWRNRVDFYN